MRITKPVTGLRVPLDHIDLSDIALYVSGDPHAVWQTLRADGPLFWQKRAAGEGFWAVTRHADVRRVLAEHRLFTSESGTALSMLEQFDPAAGRMMQATDPPRHLQYRRKLGGSFTARKAAEHAGVIRTFVRDAITPALDGEVWDAAEALRGLPMVVGALLMGIPSSDIDQLVYLAFAALAPQDPRFGARTNASTALFAHSGIMMYFKEHLAGRRKSSADDFIGDLFAADIDGCPLTEEELLFNCLSLLLGAVATTSQAISATLLALAEPHGGEGRWPREARSDALVEEALRWSSPVTHFMRRARQDFDLHGRTIRAGDAVTAWMASANRDETMFDRPYEFDPFRSVNPHISFGSGPHRCIGNNFARVMLREVFAELMEATDSFAIAAEPRHLVSIEIAGYVSLPIKLKAATRVLSGASY